MVFGGILKYCMSLDVYLYLARLDVEITLWLSWGWSWEVSVQPVWTMMIYEISESLTLPTTGINHHMKGPGEWQSSLRPCSTSWAKEILSLMLRTPSWTVSATSLISMMTLTSQWKKLGSPLRLLLPTPLLRSLVRHLLIIVPLKILSLPTMTQRNSGLNLFRQRLTMKLLSCLPTPTHSAPLMTQQTLSMLVITTRTHSLLTIKFGGTLWSYFIILGSMFLLSWLILSYVSWKSFRRQQELEVVVYTNTHGLLSFRGKSSSKYREYFSISTYFNPNGYLVN